MSARPARSMRHLLPVCSLLLCGCYSYVGIGDVTPVEGADVRIEFVAPRDVTLQDVTVHGITGVQGRIFFADTDSVVLAVTRLWGTDDRTYDATRVGVSLPRSGVAAMRAKRMSPMKSALAIAAGGAGVVAAVLGVGELVGSGGSTPPKPLP